MLIGELSRKSGISRDAIRFYEKKGLLPEEARRENSYREYSDSTVHTLGFILNLKELGFTLSEIRDFVDLFNNQSTICKTVKGKFEAHLDGLNAKMKLLKMIKKRVQNAIELCSHNPETRSCKTLEQLWH